jgi:NTP pyrophosphatase (non-canonical NTP hydrolase)
MNDKALEKFTKEVVSTFKSYEQTGTTPWNYSIAARDLPYQVGTLTKAILQLENIRHRKGKTEEELKKEIANELADIFAEVLFIAHELDISLEDAWVDMIQSDKRKIEERKVNLVS